MDFEEHFCIGQLQSSQKASCPLLEADGTVQVLVTLPDSGMYFLDLRIHRGQEIVDINQYWYHVQQDVLDWEVLSDTVLFLCRSDLSSTAAFGAAGHFSGLFF